jgi:transposase InsO family protein
VEKANYPIFLLCKVMQVSKSGYYKWFNRKNKKCFCDRNIEEEIQKIHISSRGTYGRRRILSVLKKSLFSIGKKRVSKIMHRLNLYGAGAPKFKTITKVDRKALHCPNLIPGDFKAYKPDEIWTSDISYIPTKEGWVYLCIILDTFSRRIVGWSMQEHLKKEIVLNSLNMAYKNRFGFASGIIFHSDKGTQYSSNEVKKYLKINKFHQSMSNNCYENSITETFFATLKKELVYRCNFQTRKEAKCSITEFIEVFYNRIRVHSALDYLAPMQYEAIYEI